MHTRSWQVGYAHAFPAEALAAISVAEREARWRSRLEALESGTLMYVAEVDGEVAGWVIVGASEDDDAGDGVGEVYGIYVDPGSWGRGVGAAVMAAGLDAMRSLGFEEATLWVLEDNPRARRFYERGGWSVDGARKQRELLDAEVDTVRYRRALEPRNPE